MRERLVTLLGALAAVYLVFVLLVGPREPDAEQQSMPTTADRGERGLRALQTWIESSGIRVKSLRSRYDRLPADAGLPERGNLMILTLPQTLPARQLETDALKDWVERGNSVLVLDGSIEVFAQPERRRGQPSDVLAALGFSLEFADQEGGKADKSGDATAAQAELDKDGRPRPRGLIVRGRHPVLHGIREVRVRTHSLYPLALTPKEKFRTSLVLLEDPVTGSPAFWQARIGEGTGWISGVTARLASSTRAPSAGGRNERWRLIGWPSTRRNRSTTTARPRGRSPSASVTRRSAGASRPPSTRVVTCSPWAERSPAKRRSWRMS